MMDPDMIRIKTKRTRNTGLDSDTLTLFEDNINKMFLMTKNIEWDIKIDLSSFRLDSYRKSRFSAGNLIEFFDVGTCLRLYGLFCLQFVMLTKWPDKSTTSYAMLDFESYIENL